MAGQNVGFDPNRSLTGPTPKAPTAAPTAPASHPDTAPMAGDASLVGHSRLDDQKAAFGSMWDNLLQDASRAAIMLNPITGPQAQMIAWGATGRAISRYETEVPQKPFGEILADEQKHARAKIDELPATYSSAVREFGNQTYDAGVSAGTTAVNAGAKGLNAVGGALAWPFVEGWKATKVAGNGIASGFKVFRHGFASMLRGLAGSLDTSNKNN